MNFDRDWLGPSFFENGPLNAELDADGRVIRFGLSTGTKKVTVEIEPSSVTTVEQADPDVLPEDWLSTWRDNLIQELQPKSFVPTCGFCGKTDKEVRKIIAGPSVMICNECIELCNEILSE